MLFHIFVPIIYHDVITRSILGKFRYFITQHHYYCVVLIVQNKNDLGHCQYNLSGFINEKLRKINVTGQQENLYIIELLSTYFPLLTSQNIFSTFGKPKYYIKMTSCLLFSLFGYNVYSTFSCVFSFYVR